MQSTKLRQQVGGKEEPYLLTVIVRRKRRRKMMKKSLHPVSLQKKKGRMVPIMEVMVDATHVVS